MTKGEVVDVEQVREAAVEPYADGVPVLRVVDVVGRRSGESRPVVLNVTELDGRQYVCAPDGRGWVRNLHAAGYCRVERDGPQDRDTVRRVRPVGDEEAQPVLRAQTANFPDGRATTVLRLEFLD
ncbi:nitroreductase/quinone reductase family protein [Amycolatopsis sp. NPDC051372]|uniref:nitroreductase/quinone reductase family protein n=1 Tax=unclassified Amycolatopsis TaxID=2618356 RepID=UPI00343FE2B6